MTIPPHQAEAEEFPHLLFGGHQGYDLREQWITKGLLALAYTEDPQVRARLFTASLAPDHFGIGPGMVASLRYWLRATGLMGEQPETGYGRKVPTLTPLGALLSLHDPYLGRMGSLWLLHAHLARNLLLAPTFSWFFQCFVGKTVFTKDACLEALLSWAIKDAQQQRISSALLRKDVECLFRLYAAASHSDQMIPEQSVLASPFRRLHLLQCHPSKAETERRTERRVPQYQYTFPHAEDIPELVVLALLLEHNPGMAQVPLTQVLYRQQQLGRSCGLTHITLLDACHRLLLLEPDWAPRHVWIDQQPWLTLPAVTVEQVLLRYYTQL